MGNQRGEIIIGFVVVMMVAMMTMMFVGMPMMHGGHRQGEDNQKHERGGAPCNDTIQRTNACDKDRPPVPLQEKHVHAP